MICGIMSRKSREPDEMPSSARIAQTEAPVSYVARIREHVEREEVSAARRVLAEALRAGVDEPGLANWEKLLAPGKVLGYSPASPTDFEAEMRWFAEHAQEHRGEWVAVLNGELLAHAEAYKDLRAKLDAITPKPKEFPLVHFIPQA
jgi:hypothetical protein